MVSVPDWLAEWVARSFPGARVAWVEDNGTRFVFGLEGVPSSERAGDARKPEEARPRPTWQVSLFAPPSGSRGQR